MPTPQAILLLALLTAAAALPGCESKPLSTAEQRYDFKDIKKAAPGLTFGMTRTDVLIRLGSPAVNEENRWIYKSKKILLVPGEQLIVRFDGNRYVGHEFRPLLID